jgi:hypothetical protein
MLKRCDRADLAHEPLGAGHGRRLRPEHLDRDLPLVPKVVRQVHGRHPALPKLALEAVAIGEGAPELVDGRGSHRDAWITGCQQ